MKTNWIFDEIVSQTVSAVELFACEGSVDPSIRFYNPTTIKYIVAIFMRSNK